MRKLIPAALTVLLGLASNLARAQTSDCNPPLSDIHYTRYTIAEGAVYVETNASGPVLAATNSYLFEAVINLRTNYTWTNAQLVIPNGIPQAMRNQGNHIFSVETLSTNLANITAAYPGGDYQFIVSNSVETVSVPDNPTFPNTPTLSDYAGAQLINPSQDYTLRWNPFVGGTKKDFIQVNIIGGFSSFGSPSFGCPGALNGTSTSILIPANTLTNDITYRANITFIHILTLDTNSAPFIALLAGTEMETEARIATISVAAASSPILSNESLAAGGNVRFDFSTTPGSNYTVQFAPTLSNPSWSTLLSTNATADSVSFTNKLGSAMRFYRVVEP